MNEKLTVPPLVTTHAAFELTPLCNFNCNMCYVHLSPAEAEARGGLLSTEQWLTFAERAQAMGVLFLEVTGGEALTRRDFATLYTAFIRRGFLITLRSNGYLLTEATLALLTKMKPDHISITLYGASDETYEKVCGVRNGFTRVTENIRRLQVAGIRVKLSMTATKDNQRDAEAVRIWAKDNGYNITIFAGLFQPREETGRQVDIKQMQYTDEQCEITPDMRFRPYTSRLNRSHTEAFSMCNGFGEKFCVTWDGKVTACNGLITFYEDGLTQPLDEAVKKLLDRLKRLKRPPECADCPYFDFCPACPLKFYSETGDPEKTCESICRLARYRYKQALLIRDDEPETPAEMPIHMDCD